MFCYYVFLYDVNEFSDVLEFGEIVISFKDLLWFIYLRFVCILIDWVSG